MTARRRSKKPRRKPPGKRDQSVPRSQIPEAEETDERGVLETPKQLEAMLALGEREVARMAPGMVDALLSQIPANDDALHIRLRKRESHDIAQAVGQFARIYFECLFANAKSKSREFDRKIKQSDALRDLVGNDQLSLKQIEILLETLTHQYIMGPALEVFVSAKVTEMFSTLTTTGLEERTKTLRAAARDLIDDSHSGLFAAALRDKELVSQLVVLVLRYSLVLNFKQQLQQKLIGKQRPPGRRQTPFGRFAGIAYQILEPLPDRTRLDLIAPFKGEFFGKKTIRKKLYDSLRQAGVLRPD